MSSITHKVSCQVPTTKGKLPVDVIIELVQIHRKRQIDGGWQEEVIQYKPERIICPEYNGVKRQCKLTGSVCGYANFKRF